MRNVMMALSTTDALDADNQRQILAAFRAKRATSISAARRLNELGLNDSKTLRRMAVAAVLRKAGPDRYFLDEDVLAAHRNLSSRRFKPIAIMLGLVAAAALLLALWR